MRREVNSLKIAFGPRDRLTLGVVALVMAVGAATCWFASSHSRRNWADDNGTVMSRAVQLPPTKQMAPVTYVLTVRNSEGKILNVAVSRDVYQRATPGSRIHRQSDGAVSVRY